MQANGSGAERRATMPNRRSRTAGAQRVRSSDWLGGMPLQLREPCCGQTILFADDA